MSDLPIWKNIFLQWAVSIIFEHEKVQDQRNFAIGSILPSQIHKVRYSVLVKL